MFLFRFDHIMRKIFSELFMRSAIYLASSTLAIGLLTSTANANGPIDGKVYGRLNVTIQHENNEEAGKSWKLANNASRLGFKGASEYDNDLGIIYQVEYGVEADDGDKNGRTLSQRDTYIGLTSKAGTFRAGRLTLPFKDSKGDFDLFNDYKAELGKIIEGEDRLSNVVQYDTASLFNNTVGTLAVILSESSDTEQNAADDGYSGSLVTNMGDFYLGFGFNVNINKQDQWRLSSTWQAIKNGSDNLTLGLFYQHSSAHDDNFKFADGNNEADAYGVSIHYSYNKWGFKSQYIISESTSSMTDADLLAFGIDYKLSKHSKLFAYISDRHADEVSSRDSYFALGIKHNF